MSGLMVQQLRTFATLPKDPVQSPGHVKSLTTACNPNSRGISCLWPPQAPSFTHKYKHEEAMHSIKDKEKSLKRRKSNAYVKIYQRKLRQYKVMLNDWLKQIII